MWRENVHIQNMKAWREICTIPVWCDFAHTLQRARLQCVSMWNRYFHTAKKKSVPLSSNFPNYSIFLSQNFDIKRNKTHKKYKIEARRFTNQERRKSTFLNTKNGSTTAILLEMEQLLLEFGISFFKSLQHRNADRRHTVLRRWVSILLPNISCRFQFQIMGYISQSCRTERWKPPSVSGNSVEECGKCVCDCEKEREFVQNTLRDYAEGGSMSRREH